MRRATQNKPAGRQQISRFTSYPAPIGGWNAIDPLADMKPSEAISLDNWYPRTGYCEIRGGSVSHATGMTGNGKTLAVYNGLNGLSKLFCATNIGVYDVSSTGVVGASLAARTNGKHQHLMFGDGTSNWLIMVNGVDKPLYYNGSTWLAVDGTTSPALIGVATTSLIGLAIHKGRLMFIEKESLSFWYLPSGAAGGVLTRFDLSGVAQKGGYLVAMESWTVDSGSGPDDRMVFITSEGEIIIYQGTNPSSASTWGLIGVYAMSVPLGRRCLIRIGSDLVILTQNGAIPLSTIILDTGTNYAMAVSRKIETAFNAAARSYGNTFGWKAIAYPAQSAVLVNVPLAEDGTHHQYVINTTNKSWCRFIGWDAEDFATFNEELYYCQGTKVIKAWVGYADQGNNIVGYGKTAFSYFGQRGQTKMFRAIRPVLSVNGSLDFLVDIDVDFADTELTGVAAYEVLGLGVWNQSTWNNAYWASGLQIIQNWFGVSAWDGYAAAAKIKVATKTLTVQWMSTDYMYETGEGL